MSDGSCDGQNQRFNTYNVGRKEFNFRFTMRLGQKTVEEKLVRKDWETEWFPWHSKDDSR